MNTTHSISVSGYREQFVKLMTASMAMNVAGALFGFARTRQIADIGGPQLLGLFSQLLQLQLFLSTIGLLALWNPLVRSLAKADSSEQRSRSYRTALVLQGLAVTVSLALTTWFWPQISRITFGTQADLAGFRLFLVASVPALVFANGVLQSTLHAEKRFRRQQLSAAAVSLCCAIAVIPLGHYEGVGGVLIATLLQVVGLAIAYSAAIAQTGRLPEVVGGSFDPHVANELLSSARFLFATYVAQAAIPLLVRQQVIHLFGLEANGLLQAIYTLSSLSLPIWTGIVWGRIYPELCTRSDATMTWRPVLQTLLGVHIAVVIGMSLLGKPIFAIILGRRFVEAAPMIFPQLFADTFQILVLAHAVRQIARGFESRFCAMLVIPLTFPLAAILFLPHTSVHVVPWAALAGYGITAILLEASSKPDDRCLSRGQLVTLIVTWSGFILYASLSALSNLYRLPKP